MSATHTKAMAAVHTLRRQLHTRRWDTFTTSTERPARYELHCLLPDGAASDEWRPELRDLVIHHLGKYGWWIDETGSGDFVVKLNFQSLILP